ncbi:hypothetical protein EP073_06295 [Geovibrio thiophilus]|uniref:Type II toxin-antitoxin system mRNA interferase toxin, RelE/StbE family n=1 Tax=Geovibrio thiophilus TaxID=139438 RepID=A0A410JY98_9BACT|nr:hypothetical protein EP073_06295 [Geovibrio thiophilus]
MNQVLFEEAFIKSLKKHQSIRKIIQNKIDMILADPVAMGEPLKGNLRGYCSCPVKRSFIIIYLYCRICRKKGDDAHVMCADCDDTGSDTVKFVLL